MSWGLVQSVTVDFWILLYSISVKLVLFIYLYVIQKIHTPKPQRDNEITVYDQQHAVGTELGVQ